MAKYLSMDTEATGLEENSWMIQLAFIPVDTEKRFVDQSLGIEILIQCPSFEELKPGLNKWVLEHNESLIRRAHIEGLTQETLIGVVTKYLDSKEMQTFFNKEKIALLGKSMSALDIPFMHRYFGKVFMDKYFHYHTLDVTCVARGLVDSGILPSGTQGTTKLMRHFNIRNDATHTALNDATDMGKIYFGMLDLLIAKKS